MGRGLRFRGRTCVATVLIAAAATLAFALPVRAAPAATLYRCSPTTAGGQTWAIAQRGTNCRFARAAVRLAVNTTRSPRNWRCYVDTEGTEFSFERSAVRVRCYRKDNTSRRIRAVAVRR